MCADCNIYEGCKCSGGSVFAYCPCAKGFYCSVCGHSAGTNIAEDPHLLTDILSPDLVEHRPSE